MEIESIMEEDTERVKKRPNKSSSFSKQKRKKWLFAYLMLQSIVKGISEKHNKKHKIT